MCYRHIAPACVYSSPPRDAGEDSAPEEDDASNDHAALAPFLYPRGPIHNRQEAFYFVRNDENEQKINYK